MDALIERELVEAGSYGNVYFLWRQGRCQLREFLDSIPLPEQKKLWRAFGAFASIGPPRNTEKFRKLHANVELWEIKSGPMRVVLFYDGPQRVILTHGFRKTKERTPPAEIERAVRLWEEYHASD